MNKAEMLTTMAQHTGLSRNTIKDLMKQGWRYKEGTADFRAFIAPNKVKK